MMCYQSAARASNLQSSTARPPTMEDFTMHFAKISRRVSAAVLLLVLITLTSASASTAPSDRGIRKKIQHIVLVMMENRSFDHLLGWLPHADGQQAGLSYVD